MVASWFRSETLADAEQALEGPNPNKGINILKRLAFSADLAVCGTVGPH